MSRIYIPSSFYELRMGDVWSCLNCDKPNKLSFDPNCDAFTWVGESYPPCVHCGKHMAFKDEWKIYNKMFENEEEGLLW